MATAKLKKLWVAYFEDGHKIVQNPEDKYSKHDDDSDWNPSQFRDILDYPSPVIGFQIGFYFVDLLEGRIAANGMFFSLETEKLRDRKLIYYREMERDNIEGEWQEARVIRYAMGYEGKNSEGKVEKKVIFIDA